MKRFSLLAFTFALTMVCALLTTSCNEDLALSMTLSGKWQGNWGMGYDYLYRGRVYHFDCYDTHIEFFPDYDMATTGYGRQIDYYDRGPYEYQYHFFYWTLRNGVIYLSYPGTPELNTSISEYQMNNRIFTGYFINAMDRFALYKWADYYDWGPYNSYYSYGIRNDWSIYYAPTRAEECADSVRMEKKKEEGWIVSHNNRFSQTSHNVQTLNRAE